MALNDYFNLIFYVKSILDKNKFNLAEVHHCKILKINQLFIFSSVHKLDIILDNKFLRI